MKASIERTDEAIVIKLPLDTKMTDLKWILNYFEYVDLVSKSKATQPEIDALAKEVKSGWWEQNKHRFEGVEEFKDFL